MQRDSNFGSVEAHAKLALSLCDVAVQLIALAHREAKVPMWRTASPAANDNNSNEPVPKWPTDPMTMAQVQVELRLKGPQIVKLRRLWGFPCAVHQKGRLIFSRAEVEGWARNQPDPENFAAVLRLRRRRYW